MLTYLQQLWHSEDLRKRILFTLFLLLVYRFVAHIPVPGADPIALRNFLEGRGASGALGVFAALTGGAIDNFSIVLLGLSPYINASIILQLCTVIFPKLEAISKEGQQGQQKINRFTRWLTFPLAILQSYGFLLLLNSGASQLGGALLDTSFPGILGPMIVVSAGALFLMIGIIYERTHTRAISDYGGFARVIPWYAGIFIILVFASIGLPGTNGFIGEFLIILGAFSAHKLFGVLAATGIILGAGYMLWLYQRLFFEGYKEGLSVPDINLREVVTLLPLIILVFLIGFYPDALLDFMHPSVEHLIGEFRADTNGDNIFSQYISLYLGGL